MPPTKLPTSVLVALGLVSACRNNDTDSFGPCLDFATEDTGTDVDTDTFGPCLDVPPDTDVDTDTDTAPPAARRRAPTDATRRVLDRGVLPDDVAKLLNHRRTE